MPDLQMFTRGCTAALKRLAVILLEDAWAPSARPAQLLGAALLSQRLPSWHPSQALMTACCRVAMDATSSAWYWQLERGVGTVEPERFARVVPYEASADGPPALSASLMQTCAYLLRLCKSFAGDIKLYALAAQYFNADRLQQAQRPPPEFMPVWHAIDFHGYRGMAHLTDETIGTTFAIKFKKIFQHVTGTNPRTTPAFQSAAHFEQQAMVQMVRRAQLWTLLVSVKAARQPCAVIGTRPLAVALDSGVLAAGVGPVNTTVHDKAHKRKKTDVIVTLGCHTPGARAQQKKKKKKKKKKKRRRKRRKKKKKKEKRRRGKENKKKKR